MQLQQIKSLKANMEKNEAVMQEDFSEKLCNKASK